MSVLDITSDSLEETIPIYQAPTHSYAKIRGQVASGVGAKPDATWEDIGKATEHKVRTETAEGLGASPDADWDEIGQRIEDKMKAAIGGWAGASASDDWGTVGRKVGSKIETAVNEALHGKKKEEPVKDDHAAPWE